MSALTKYQHRHPRLTTGIDHRSPSASSRGSTLFCASTSPGARLRRYLASFVHSPVPSEPMHPAACPINASTCSGRCSSPLTTSTHSSAPRTVSIAASKASKSFDGLGALAPRLAQRTLGLAPLRLLARAYLAQSSQRLALALNRRIRATLQPPAHLVHLVEHMEAVITLLGVGKDLSDPRRNPLRRILDHHRQPKPLRLALAKHPCPRPRIARRTQRQPEQIPTVEVHPRQHRLALAEHLIQRPRPAPHRASSAR